MAEDDEASRTATVASTLGGGSQPIIFSPEVEEFAVGDDVEELTVFDGKIFSTASVEITLAVYFTIKPRISLLINEVAC